MKNFICDGAEGSGNFGHAGRKGKVGGSSKSGSTNNPDTKRIYGRERVNKEELSKLNPTRKKEYLSTIDKEKQITTIIEKLIKTKKMYMVGEKFAIKQPASYDRKIDEIMFQKNVNEEEAIKQCSDTIRYTSISSSKNLVKNTKEMLQSLFKEGYRIAELKNTWSDSGNPYKGINIKMVSPDNTKFELQVHTAQSYDMKEKKQHKYYEEWRLPTTTEERKKELSNIMFEYITKNEKWNVPKDIEKLSIEYIKN